LVSLDILLRFGVSLSFQREWKSIKADLFYPGFETTKLQDASAH